MVPLEDDVSLKDGLVIYGIDDNPCLQSPTYVLYVHNHMYLLNGEVWHKPRLPRQNTRTNTMETVCRKMFQTFVVPATSLGLHDLFLNAQSAGNEKCVQAVIFMKDGNFKIQSLSPRTIKRNIKNIIYFLENA
jgi:hypothetical protein